MVKTLEFVKLDFRLIKPYLTLKNLFIYLAIVLLMSFYTQNSAAIIGMFMAIGALYVSYPFAVGEKNSIDILYATLSLTRGNVVLGRYVFVLFVDLIAALLSYLVFLGVFMVLNLEINALEAVASLIGLFFIFSLIQAIQLPIYFKLGYAKAKAFAYLPFLGVPLIVFALAALFQKASLKPVIIGMLQWLTANTGLAICLLIVVWLIAAGVSYGLSLHYYKQRDL